MKSESSEMQPKPPTPTVRVLQDNALKATPPDNLPNRIWLVRSEWGVHTLFTSPTDSEGVDYGRLDRARAVAPHTEDTGEVCTEDCQGCNDPIAALIADRNKARAEAFRRGQELERRTDSLSQDTSGLPSQDVPDHSPASLPDSSAVEALARECAEKIDAHISERLDRHTSPQVETMTSIIAPYINPAKQVTWSNRFPTTNGWYWMRNFRQYRQLPVEVDNGQLSMMFGMGRYSPQDVEGAEFTKLAEPPYINPAGDETKSLGSVEEKNLVNEGKSV